MSFVKLYKMPPDLIALYRDLKVPKEDWGKPSGVVIAFAHGLKTPAGKYITKPLRLRKFQLAFIRAVYNPTADAIRLVKQAILSVARRNGKTLLLAVLILVHLVGPYKSPNATLVSAATTREQAAIVFRYVRDMIRVNATLAALLKITESTKHIVHRHDGSVYAAISAEAGGHFGQGLDFCVYDELSQAKNRELYGALMTSLGSNIGSLMVIISTQAPADTHLLSELIDYGLKVNQGIIRDKTFVCQLHSADAGADLLDEKQWAKANPALGDYRDKAELRQAMRRAKKIPSLESQARVYYLNQRVAAHAALISPDTWQRNAGMVDDAIFFDGRPVYAGLDLSARIALTSFALAAEDDDKNVHVKAYGWTPKETMFERADADRAQYPEWVDQGLLFAVPGSSIDYDFVAHDILRITQGMNLVKISYDRWRIEELKQAAARVGVILPLSPFGQGFKDMSPAVEAFEGLAVEGKLRHGNSPVLRWCVSNTTVDSDPAGNRKPSKAVKYGRIDHTVAMIMAIGGMKTQPTTYVDVSAMIA